MDIDTDIFNKRLPNKFNSILKGSFTVIKWDLSLDTKRFNIHESINVIHINRIKEKNIIINTENHLPMIQSLKKFGQRRNIPLHNESHI